MANECTFCRVRHIPTNTLVLNGGTFWCEFCDDCAANNALCNEQGEYWLVSELWDRAEATKLGLVFIRDEGMMARAKQLGADAEERMAREEEARDYEEYLYQREEEAYWKAWQAEQDALLLEREQLAVDHWENVVDRCYLLGRTPPQFIVEAA